MGREPGGSTLAPSLAGSQRVTASRLRHQGLLHGLTGRIDGKTYTGGVMVPMGTNTDEWIADAASYVRNSFGNSASIVTPAHVARVRAADRKTPWTQTSSRVHCRWPRATAGTWKVTASHNLAEPRLVA